MYRGIAWRCWFSGYNHILVGIHLQGLYFYSIPYWTPVGGLGITAA